MLRTQCSMLKEMQSAAPSISLYLWKQGVYGYMHSYTCKEAGHLGKTKSTLMKQIAVRLYSAKANTDRSGSNKEEGF
jgi:hypothetical protein